MLALRKVYAFFICLLCALPSIVVAHPGHDHGSSQSVLLHTLTYLSVVVAIGGISFFIYKKRNRQHGE